MIGCATNAASVGSYLRENDLCPQRVYSTHQLVRLLGVSSATVRMEMHVSDDIKLFYSPAEVQSALGIKHSKFWELVKAGAFDVRKMGRRTLITAESLRHFAAELPKAAA